MQHTLCIGLQLCGTPCGDHDPQHVFDALLCSGYGFCVRGKTAFEQRGHFFGRRIPFTRYGTGKRNEGTVKLRIIDRIVAFIVECTVYIAQKLANLLDGQRVFQGIDRKYSAELAACVFSLLRRG